MSGLKDKLHEEKARIRDLWRTNCQCMAEYDDEIAAKDNEIEELRHQLSSRSEVHSVLPHTAETRVRGNTRTGEEPLQPQGSRAHRGKAPPVDPFTGENLEIRIDEWLPSLERARAWNDWTEEELLLQLAGHLRGRALQEWGLLNEDSKRSYVQAVDALRLRLDPGSRTLAAQDFRHTSQTDEERVADVIHRLERTFNVAYGREGMSSETRDTLLHGQLQDGLKHELMRAPAVSGAQSYPELCLAARNEEKRLAELKKRQQYLKPSATPLQPMKEFTENKMFVPSTSDTAEETTSTEPWSQPAVQIAEVPTVRAQVRLVQSLRLLPHQGASVSVQLEPVSRLQVTGEQSGQGSTQPMVKRITEEEATQRKQILSELVGQPELLTPEQAEQLHQLLGEHHAAFCLEPNERGETDILSMEIDTGGAPPKKQAARRMPFAVKSEVSKQLRTMQEAGVMQPSNSSWASPVVMVRKRDRTHRFCVDYRELNSVTKANAFPLPRIDDHLDQLGEARYFTILDLTWYWQICMHPDSVAFITSREATGEKPSFLLFGFNGQTPTEAALLPPNPIEPTTVVDYRNQVMLSLSTARELTAKSIQKAQKKYKLIYDRKAAPTHLKVGDWALIKFPAKEVGKLRKLSRPWHGPYRVVSRADPVITAVRVYSPQDKQIRVHLSRVTPCPSEFPPGYYWYGTKRHSPGRPPKWVQQLLAGDVNKSDTESDVEDEEIRKSSAAEVDSDSESIEPPNLENESDSEDDHGIELVTETLRSADSGSNCYSLRRRVTAPKRLMVVKTCSGSSSPGGEGDVAD